MVEVTQGRSVTKVPHGKSELAKMSVDILHIKEQGEGELFTPWGL